MAALPRRDYHLVRAAVSAGLVGSAVAKALARIRQSTADRDEAVDKLIRLEKRVRPRFLAKHAGRYRVIAQEEVNYFAIEEGLVALHTAGQRCWMDVNLGELERRLDPSEFVRISRECLVRIAAVSEVLPLVGGYAEVVLRSGDRLQASRRRLRDFLENLGAIT
jgi:DNA-binding LytR/AlgR family response regulator